MSLKEVKELAKGLIFHYSFNDEINESTTNECNLNNWEAYTSYWTINEKTETGLKLLRTSTTASPTVALRNSTLLGKMAAGDVWTFSCYLYVDGEPYKTSINTLSTYAGFTKTKVESRDDGYFSVTFTVNNTSDTWIIHSAIFGSVELNIPCEFRYMLFEKRDRATPYTKTSRLIQFYIDESGNGYNASPSNLTFTLNSNHGKLAAKFNGSTSGLAVPNVKLDLMTSDYTFAFWIYPNTNNRDTIFGDYNTSASSNVNIERKSSTGNLRIYYTSTNDLDMGNSTSMPMNTWTHIAISYDANIKLITIYKNGILATSKTLDVSGYVKSAGGTWWIGRDGRSTAPENLDGLLSDFKFYSTCLSGDDIKDLYNVKLNASNKNDIFCSLFLENETSFSLNKKFQLKSKEFEELDIPPEYQKLDYITFNGSLYIDTGYKANQDTSVRMIVSSSSTANQAFYCSRSGLSNNTYSCFIVDSKIRHDYGATQTAVNVTATKNLLYKVDNYKNILKINGVTHTINKTSFTASQSMYIGASNANGIGNYLYGNVYYCIIYDKDLIVKHLIPVKRLSDNVIGMYDIVTNLFLTNSGTGTFTPGDESSTNSELNIFKNGIILCRQLIED